ncbi:HugZ family protein [Qingshengfaniella alkalisoli]|uniref:Pyridoxamine 5-phosphate oxidase n=1 Tax=Qingshengfaniella alkalisoli TaxID=2599296 RepID=A0A5B8ITN3_9RHOB|nr:pyridoxamine 5'-phosphate oxidase family protein [Qingshengfaniella alkalisoli]QDY68823.1 pyridoxamine 5-phosphate oxidase [Qingshengfaniella alkalisoli]
MSKTDPIRPTDGEARELARSLLSGALFGALGVIDPDTGHPSVTRVAVLAERGQHPVTLISNLSAHTQALRVDPRCSLLLGEPGERGDPLTHPRISLTCNADFIDRASATHIAIRDTYLKVRPKATLYVDFPDFSFVRLTISGAALNGGFGKAFILTPADLGFHAPNRGG